VRAVVRAGGAFALADLPPPDLPGEGWVEVAVARGGICGSDLRAGVGGGRVVMGHEVAGTAPGGQRVVLDPLIRCAARGRPPCAECRAGRYASCDRLWDGGDGKAIGFRDTLGGGWADAVAAHADMLVPVPDRLPWRTAVLAEPLAVAVSAVRDLRRGAPGCVAVVGGGTLGQLTAVAVRALLPDARVVHVVRHEFQAAATTGAVLVSDDGVPETAAALGVPWTPGPSGPLLLDGPDAVLDAGGTTGSVDLALRLARRGGAVTTLGNPVAGPDLRPLWLKSLVLTGHLEYHADPRPPDGEDANPFVQALRLLATRPRLGETLVTHEVPLADYAVAIDVARHRAEHRAIKVALVP
jgi:threonine dehydrogenase-like Zn-dependent dehydrogenase